jgi:hypothetical protein
MKSFLEIFKEAFAVVPDAEAAAAHADAEVKRLVAEAEAEAARLASEAEAALHIQHQADQAAAAQVLADNPYRTIDSFRADYLARGATSEQAAHAAHIAWRGQPAVVAQAGPAPAPESAPPAPAA